MEFPPIRILEGLGHLPIAFQIKNNLKHAISSGHLQPNTQLPSVRELAAQLNVAANTVARAYKELQDEGLLVTHPGRGTFVADIVQNRNFGADKREALYEILQPAITSAQAIGYTQDQILAVVGELCANRTIPVGLIGINKIVLAKWKRILEEEFTDLGVEVIAFTVSDIQSNRNDALLKLTSAYYIFSLITTYAETRSSFHDLNKQIVALITEVSMATHRMLATLPHEEKIGLVCEDIYVNNLMGLIEPYVDQARIRRVSPDDLRGLKDLLEDVTFVLHTLSPKELLKDLAKPAQQLVEIEFLPNRACFEQIRQMLLKEAVPV